MGASGHGGYPWLARLGEILGRTGPEVPKAILCKKLGESWLYEHSRLGSHGQGMQHAQLPFLQLRKSFDNIKKDAPLVFALHGDAAPHTETDSLMVVSLRSLTTKLCLREPAASLCLAQKHDRQRNVAAYLESSVLEPRSYDQGKVAYESMRELAHLQSQQWRQTSHGL